MSILGLALGFLISGPTSAVSAGIEVDLSTARLMMDGRGAVTSLIFADGTRWPGDGRTAFALETRDGTVVSREVTREGDLLRVAFEDGSTARFRLKQARGVAFFRLEAFQSRRDVERLRLFRLPWPEDQGVTVAETLNGAHAGGWSVAVQAADINTHAKVDRVRSVRANRAGCSHRFTRTTQARVGRAAARFDAKADATPGGWSVVGKTLERPLDLTGCHALRLWVHGDGRGEQLKIQLQDGLGGYRDSYVPIDFEGWRSVTLSRPPLETIRYDHVTSINFFYNGLPPGLSVSCRMDHVEAILRDRGGSRTVLLEDFESVDSPLWGSQGGALTVETVRAHGLTPAGFAIVVAPSGEFWESVERFEGMARIPSPRPEGAWGKRSPAVARSYLFLTNFHASQFDQALAMARRGGFATVLIGQESWTRGTGHFAIDEAHFPGGLETLRRTVDRFHQAGLRVGLHLLAPSISGTDPYLTPVPDPRLVLGARTALASDIDETTNVLPTTTAPGEFPAVDGGYEGAGTVLRIGDELIAYGHRTTAEPFGFAGCRRGYLGTRPARHRSGDRVAHLVRAYNYHMFDLDTTLTEEVAANFAKVADACRIDMVYFDGSERLQGDHWYYNGRLHKAFVDALRKKDLLIQASSISHYSWHIMSRTASADGHGDLKGYLEQRSAGFGKLAEEGMPLDIGWYYGYDPNSTLDEYEYVLGATIGYGASMSFQVSPVAAIHHPFTGPLLDLISRYEGLRLTGRVPEAMRGRLRIDPALVGIKSPADRERLAQRSRQEYRLVGPAGRETLQRVVYAPWQEVRAPENGPATRDLEVADGPARAGFWVHAQGGPWLAPGPSYEAPGAQTLESFDDLAPYAIKKPSRARLTSIGSGEGGSTSPGVTHGLKIREDEPRSGRRYGIYTAENTRPAAGGWSVIGKTFDPPLDLSWHRALGLWLKGDGRGGLFKLQLLAGSAAADYYIKNDFTGWRYQQLARPQIDRIDYSKVRSLMFYFNGLPGRSAVACGIDDVKALRAVDHQELTNPFVEIGGKRLSWNGTLRDGDYLACWPGEPALHFRPGLEARGGSWESTGSLKLEPGNYPLRFGGDAPPGFIARFRVTLQPPKSYEIPPPAR